MLTFVKFCGKILSRQHIGGNIDEKKDVNAMKLDMDFIKNNDIPTAAERLLLFLGFKSHLMGTNYLTEAITLKYFNIKMSCLNIYFHVARKHHATAGSVERAIRHAMRSCRNEGNIKDFNLIVGYHAIDRKFDTTTNEFISIVSKWLHWVRRDEVANQT